MNAIKAKDARLNNRAIKLVTGLVFASLMLAGCASGPKFTAAPSPTTGKALIYVYRKSSALGVVGYDKVYVNDSFIGAIRSGGYAKCEVPQGTAVFYVTPRVAWSPVALDLALLTNFQKKQYEKLRIDVDAGKTYYVNLYVAFAGHEMKVKDQATGAKEIRKLKLANAEEDK